MTNTREATDALAISLKRAYNILGQCRGWADVVRNDLLEAELAHMQHVIEDYQLKIIKQRSLRTRPEAQIKVRRLPGL